MRKQEHELSGCLRNILRRDWGYLNMHVLCPTDGNHLYNLKTDEYEMSRSMTKPTKWHVHPVRLRSASASTQSDQSLHCPHEGWVLCYPGHFMIKRTTKTDQTGWTPRVILVFAGHTSNFVGFVMLLLKLYCPCGGVGGWGGGAVGNAQMGTPSHSLNCSCWVDIVTHMKKAETFAELPKKEPYLFYLTPWLCCNSQVRNWRSWDKMWATTQTF